MTFIDRLVRTHFHRFRILENVRMHRDVFRNVDQHRTGTAGGRDMECFLMVEARSLMSLTRKLCFTQGRVMPTVSHSWNASWPIAADGTCPEITTIGIESM